MARDGQVLLHFVEFGREDGGDRVLLPVHGLLLQRGVQLGEGHGHGVGAQGVEHVDVDGRLDHADLQARQVFSLGDGLFAVGDVAKAQLPVGQAHQVLGLELVEQLLAEGAIGHGIGFLRRGKQEGEVVNAEFLGLRRQDARVQHRHLHRAALQGRHGLQVAAQRAAGEQLDLDLAAALGRHQVGKLLRALGLGVVLLVLEGELDGAVLGVRARHQRGSHQRRGQQGFQEGHGRLLGRDG